MKKYKKRLLLLLLALAIAICGTSASDGLNDAMEIFAQTKGGAMLTADLQNVLYQKLSQSEKEYVTVSRDGTERVTSIQIHSVALSLLSSEMTVLLLEEMDSFKHDDFGIPLGNLTSSAFFSDRGPLIPVRPVLLGTVASEIRSTVESSGINQTLHRVAIRFVVTVRYLAPLTDFIDTLTFEILISETLVVGDVPIYRD